MTDNPPTPITCPDCREEMQWMWLLAEPAPGWFALCMNTECERGPRILKDLEP